MPITDDVRKTITDPKPLYFVAGSAELAYQQAKKVPGLIEQLAAEAPARIDAVRNTDPKEVQDKAAARAKEAREVIQSRVGGFISNLDTDLKKIGEGAQDLALRGVGVAFEYAVQAREKYDQVAEHGEQTVRAWRGEAAEGLSELAETVEPDAVDDEGAAQGASAEQSAASTDAGDSGAQGSARKTTAAKKTAADKPAAKKTTAKKTTPPTK
ncbi:hypothetical protein [Streptomyces flavofungini]|uniref:Heparin-binding hemagglutinin n=1 Tax=Streptomyces flavofungini TaxID=68200 RepID=A0ABS0X1A0_9ACTN|nr:hypothetical protein [Streptomyces flavofungini]MBJ3806957.1 hypothetical protein [Streptomyces flavofungini]GHC59423.1 hypothetical protein GCM10010349_28110 [Streptomyces flavofungini]